MTRQYRISKKRWINETGRFKPNHSVGVNISRSANSARNTNLAREESRAPELPAILYDTLQVPTISDERYLKAIVDFQSELHPNNFVFKYCSTCSRISSTLSFVPLSDIPQDIFLLQNAPLELQEAGPPTKDCEQGLTYMLYEIFNDRRGEYCTVCDECLEDISNGEMPLFSIPNFCFPEPQPELFQDISVAETLLISKVYPRTVIYQNRMHQKNSHSYMKGHCVSFENDIANPVTVLPRSNDDLNQILRVVFVGTSQQSPYLPKINTVNSEKVLQCLRWLKQFNIRYRDIIISENLTEPLYVPVVERIETLEQVRDRIPLHHSFEISEEELSWRNENV
ncbi:hypothetical protein HDV02_003082 [Globomyces sp. JEL0801]|nr:hypothetical protein HDV02_003082 [Globomyces sp. JEL0801]